jgi:hypothetical protein
VGAIDFSDRAFQPSVHWPTIAAQKPGGETQHREEKDGFPKVGRYVNKPIGEEEHHESCQAGQDIRSAGY